jgi:hypothetical protein
MREVGLEHCWSLDRGDGEHAGISRSAVLRFVGSADFLLNVMGFTTDEELLGAARLRVFLDTDPGFAQMWYALGLADLFAHHDAHVTIGERIGAADCGIPVCGRRWLTTPQPVVLDHWPPSAPADVARFTSVASWRGSYGPVDYRGRRYGLRAHEFRRFADLPHRAGGDFELALDIHPADGRDAQRLRDGGWSLVSPAAVASSLSDYRRYLQRSGAELMVAKGMYVDTRGGWMSERSLCYLASGRPVLAQDTGFACRYPTGDGLLAFSTLDEALAGVEAIRSSPARHGAAARALAEEHFASDRVLQRLVDRLGSIEARGA